MGTGGYLEIYTTLFGWQFYDLLWRLFSDTGIIFIPIIGALISNWKEPAESQDDKPAASTSLRRNSIQLPIMLAVFMFAVVPVYKIAPNMLSYKDQCTEVDVTGDQTKTTYDRTLGNYVKGSGDVTVPVWWLLIMKTGAGMSSAMRGEAQCLNNLRDWDSLLRTASIQDDSIRNEYNRFYSECYLPSMSKYKDPAWDHWKNEQVDKRLKYLRSNTPKPQTGIDHQLSGVPTNEHRIRRLFAEDMNYIAPRLFLQTDGFYKACSDHNYCGFGFRANTPVDGWPYDSDRDADYTPYELDLVAQGKRSGRPTCQEWWSGPAGNINAQARVKRGAGEEDRGNKTLSLKRQMIEGAMSTDGVIIESWLDEKLRDTRMNLFGPSEFEADSVWDYDRMIVKRLLRNGPPEWTGGDYGVESTADKALLAGIVALGGESAFEEGGKFYIGLMFMREVAPMVKAMILMSIYMMLIVYMIMSGYTIESVMPISMLIISIMCWSGLWEFARIIDENLFLAMYPDPNVWGGGSEMGPKRLILDLLTTALFILFPLALSWMMTMAGVMGARGISSLSDQGTNPARNLGSSTGGGAARKSSNLVK